MKKIFILSLLLTSIGCSSPVEEYKAAGFFIITQHKNQLHMLLGKEGFGKQKGKWCSFSGRREKHEHDPLETAAREFSEETRTVLGDGNREKSIKAIKKAYHASGSKQLKVFYDDSPKTFFAHVAEIDYTPAERFTMAPKINHYEKTAY